jgi:hypothetical protein
MDLTQAKELVGVLFAAYRVNDQATATVYVGFLQDLDPEVGRTAINLLIQEEAEWMPTIAAIRQRHDMLLRELVPVFTPLPPIELSEDDQEKVKELLGEYWGQPGRDKGKVALAAAVASGAGAEEKIELGRIRARELIAAEAAGEERVVPEPTGNRDHLKLCSGVGKPWAIRGGKRVCPCGCGLEEEPF